MAGFTEKHSLNETILEGGQIVSDVKLMSVEWQHNEKFSCAKFIFSNKEGMTELKLSNPVVNKPFNNKTLAESNEFLEKKFSSCMIHVAQQFGILDTLPKTDMSPKQMTLLLQEKLTPFFDKDEYSFFIKISKNNKGWAEVSQERPFLERQGNKTTTNLFFTDYDKKMNSIVRLSSYTTEEKEPQMERIADDSISTSTPFDDDI